MYTDGSETNFVSLYEVLTYTQPIGSEPKYISVQIQMSDKLVVSKRQVYSTMIFLGDVGGIFSSVFFIGSALHFCLVSQSAINSELL